MVLNNMTKISFKNSSLWTKDQGLETYTWVHRTQLQKSSSGVFFLQNFDNDPIEAVFQTNKVFC